MIETEDIRLSQERVEALRELLTPMKDLAKNWNIDINVELEKYMSSFGNDLVNASDNFSEAALVVQGSTGVWCKKVEFLHSLAVDSVGMVSEQNKSSVQKDGSRGAEDADETEMMTLHVASVKKSSNVHIDLELVNRVEQFKPKIPLCLSSILVKNDSPDNLLYNDKGELLATKDDFIINKFCIFNASCFATIDLDSLLLLNKGQGTKSTAPTPFFKRRNSQYDGFVKENHDLNPAVVVDNTAFHQSNAELNNLTIAQVQGNIDDEVCTLGALDLSDSDCEISMDLPVENNEPKTPHQNFSTPVTLPPKSLTSQSTMLCNPHEDVPSRPFKKCPTEKPRATRKRKKNDPPKCPLTEVLQAKTSRNGKDTKKCFPNAVRKPLFLENEKLFKNINKKDIANIKRTVQKKLSNQSIKQMCIPSDLFQLPKPSAVTEQQLSDDVEDYIDDGFDGPDDEANDFNVEVAAEISKDLTSNETSQQHHLEAADIKLSYEDLVREHVQTYTSVAKHHFHVSELRGRVLEWESKITPILEEEERDIPFDVAHYSNKLISKLAGFNEEKVAFGSLCEGEKRSEVCRLFLTSLMLTNSGNIDLTVKDRNAQCTLLSKKLFSEVLESYVAPSDPVSSTSASKGSKQGKVR